MSPLAQILSYRSDYDSAYRFCMYFRISVHMCSALCQPLVLRHTAIMALVLLSCFASVAFISSWFTSSASSPLPFVPSVFRRTNSFVDNDADAAKKLTGLVQRRATAYDPELIQFIRRVMDPPSKHMIKTSRMQLITSPQSREVDKVLKRKVLQVYVCTLKNNVVCCTVDISNTYVYQAH